MDNKPDVLAVTKSWLTPENGDYVLSTMCPPGYSGLHESKSSRRGGGVSVIFKSSLSVQRMTDLLTFESFEFLNQTVAYHPRRVRILVVYRPPKQLESIFVTEFRTVLEILSAQSEKVLIVRDFNLHVDVPDDKWALEFISLVEMFVYCQRVKTPTRSRKKRRTDQGHTLDLVSTRQECL